MSADRIWILLARKLSGEASPQELRELEELLRLHPDGHFSTDLVSILWNQSQTTNELELESAYHRHLERMEQAGLMLPAHQPELAEGEFLINGSRRKRVSIRYRAWAAALVITLAAGGWLFLHRTPSSIQLLSNTTTSEIATKNGSRSSVRLPDGSIVWLNAGSKLTYDKKYGNELREVTLAGEGYFDVVKNPEKPFVIHTVAMDVKVLGTVFNVRSYPGDKTTEATLIRGSIEVSFRNKQAEKIILKPNEKIVVANTPDNQSGHPAEKAVARAIPSVSIGRLTYDEKDSTIRETAWMENKLSFYDESFGDIARRMERWYGVQIIFEDESLLKQHFTGSFKEETVQEALNALRTSFRFNYTIEGKDTIILK